MKKSIAGVLASALALNSLLMMPISTFAVESVTVEAEDATINGVGEVKSSIKGFTGTGYVDLTDNTAGAPSVTFTVDMAEAGSYGLTVRYATSYGSKPIAVTVNGDPAQGGTLDASDTFENFDAGKVALKAGKNEITVTASWGWMQVDSITVGEYKAPERPAITASHKALSDPDATDAAKQVFAYLHSVYGEHILSGQQEIYNYGPHAIETEFNYIKEKTGKLPAIRGFDYGNFCCPAFGSDDGSTDRVIAWAEQGGLATASFHLNVPTDFASYTIGSKIAWDKTTYTQNTDFSPAKAATEGTKENQYYTQALDTLCEQFAILQEKGITVLWRPLHEAEGGGGENGSWFWWGREGSKTYRELYQYTYKYITGKGIHNLIWEWNSYDFSSSANWYPGDNYVDIIGYDKYNCTDWSTNPPTLVHNTSAETNLFYSMMARYGNTKMVALMECDSFSTLGTITEEKAGWLYFMPWYDGGQDSTNFLSNPVFNTEEDLIEMYQSEYCITLDELPDFTKIAVTDETNVPVNTEPAEILPGHASIATDSKGVTTVDFPEASDTVVLDIDIATNTAANGGLGTSIEYQGKYYWVNVEWKATKSGEVEIVLADNVLNVTEGIEPVEDETLKAAILAKLPTQKGFQFQVWDSTGGKSSEVVLKDAYVKKSGTSTDPTEPTTQDKTEPTTQEKTEPTTADPSKQAGTVKTDSKGVTTITFPAAADTYYLDVTIPAGATYANGGLGCSIEIDGEYYWANVQWEAKKSGEVAIDPVKNFLNVSLGTEEVEDEAIIEVAKKAVAEQTSFQFQAWYTDKGESTDIVLNDAYIKAAATDPTDTTLPEAKVYGDINGDEVVDIMDVISFNKYLLGGSKLDAQAQANADTDKSGKLDSNDALNILKKALEMIELPIK